MVGAGFCGIPPGRRHGACDGAQQCSLNRMLNRCGLRAEGRVGLTLQMWLRLLSKAVSWGVSCCSVRLRLASLLSSLR